MLMNSNSFSFCVLLRTIKGPPPQKKKHFQKSHPTGRVDETGVTCEEQVFLKLDGV